MATLISPRGPSSKQPAFQLCDVPEGDYALVVGLSEELARETDPDSLRTFDARRTHAALRLIANDPFGRIVGAYAPSGLMGVLMLGGYELSEWDGGRYVIVSTFYIARAYRGKGIGRALYREARATARARGAVGIALHVHETNEDGQSVYMTLGMRQTRYILMREQF